MNPLRDDHVATLARADALDVELERTRRELAHARTRIDTLEHAAPERTPAPRRLLPWVAFLVVALTMIGGIGWLAIREPRAATPEPDAPAVDAYRVPIDDPDFELSCPLDEPYVP